MAPLVAAQLTHPIPILRYYAVAALEQLLGTPAPMDVHANNEVIVRSANEWLVRNKLKGLSAVSHQPSASGEDTDP